MTKKELEEMNRSYKYTWYLILIIFAGFLNLLIILQLWGLPVFEKIMESFDLERMFLNTLAGILAMLELVLIVFGVVLWRKI